MIKSKLLVVLVVWSIVFSSCKKEENTIIEPGNTYQLSIPSHMPTWVNDKDNPLTKDGVKLGRLLFYDKRLSGNNQLSCASCHRQELAFSDGVALNNIGISKQQLHRHTPTLFNLLWTNKGLFWDGGSTNLESQAFGPLTNFDEMAQDLKALETELKEIPQYQSLFSSAFNDGITAANVVKALAQFQRTLISATSRYDKYKLNQGVQLSPLELKGMSLIEQKCKTCHAGELFTDNSYHNNGLNASFNTELEGIAQGRFRVSYHPLDMGAFKTPSLRNVMLTAPYMHDGRFTTIDQVLEHYNSGIKPSSSIDAKLFQNNGQLGIPISPTEKLAIKAFLAALTDNDFISNKAFSNPNQ